MKQKQKQKQKQSTHRFLKTLAARVQAETLRLPNQNRLEIHFAATLFGFARLEDWREKKARDTELAAPPIRVQNVYVVLSAEAFV